MIDPELKAQLELINNKLEKLCETNSKPSRWWLFIQGVWRGFGYLIGLIIAIALLGWFLNIIGVIPFLKDISYELKAILTDIRTIK